MAKSKQESCGDLYELARDYARAEAAEERMRRKIWNLKNDKND